MISIYSCEAMSGRWERDRQKKLKQFASEHDTTNSRNCSLQLVNYPHFGFWQKPNYWVLIKVRWCSVCQCLLCRCEGWAVLQVFLMPHAAHKCCMIIWCASLLQLLLCQLYRLTRALFPLYSQLNFYWASFYK